MDDAIKDIIDKTLELEGLLLLAQSRAGSELEASVNRLVILKKEEVAKLIDAAFGSEPKCEVEPQPIVMPIVEAATVEEIAETIEPEENFIAEPVEDTIEGPSEESIEKPVEEPSEEPEPLENFIPEPIEMPVEPPVSDIFDDSHLEPIEEPQPIEVPAAEDKPIFDDAPIDDEDAPLDDEYEDDEDDDEVLDDDDEALTLDEALQRSMSRDLRKAFSLNDRFRYRRELFGNSDVEMNDTLNLVETMHSYSEAEEFFYGDLEWDSESPEVKDFMAVIRNHFYNKEQ